MADRYWVTASGDWSNSANWSTTSGGAGGASVPTASDDAIFDNKSRDGAVTISTVVTCFNLRCENYKGSFTRTANNLNIYGSATFSPGMTVGVSTSYVFQFQGVGTHTIRTNGVYISSFVFLGAGTYSFTDNVSARSISHNAGTLNLGSYTYTCNDFQIQTSTVKTLNMGSATIITSNNGTAISCTTAGGANVVVNSQSSKIIMTGATSSISGGGRNWNEVTFASTVTSAFVGGLLNGSYQKLSYRPATAGELKFHENTIIKVYNFDVRGTASAMVTIRSANGSGTVTTNNHTLEKIGNNEVHCDYLNIRHSIATPVLTWYAGNNSIDNQSIATPGSGWTFATGPTSLDNGNVTTSSLTNPATNNATLTNQTI